MSGGNKWRVILLIIMVTIGVVWIREKVKADKTEVIFCDVKQGDGIIVKEGSYQMIVDVGPDNKEMLRCLNKFLPFWDKNIEIVILTHEDNDHVGGLGEVEKHYRTERLMGGVNSNEQFNYTDYLSTFDVIRLGKIEFEVLWPESKEKRVGEDNNSNSIVGKLRVGENIFLLMGDADAETEERLVWRGVLRQAQGKLNYLKVSHHGSKNGTTKTLLEIIKPEVAVISVGKNWFGHPSEEVLERLLKVGVKIWRTDEKGDIKIKMD